MPATVIVNNLTVVHKTSEGTTVAAVDVCKTPTPSGPMPLPYVNTALSRQLARGTKRVRIDRQPAMLKTSSFASSAGDEPGTLGGIVSGKSRGKATPRSFSLDVKFEGQPVVRFTDMMVQNAGAAPNSAGIVSQPSGAALALDFDKPELLDMYWSKQDLCCGDPVTLSVRTRNAAGRSVAVLVKRTGGRKPIVMESLPVEVKGDHTEYPWLSRWCGDFAATLPAVAVQRTLRGAEQSSNALEFLSPQNQARTTVRRPDGHTPQYEKNKTTGAWEKNGKFYRWPVAYDIEILNGWMVVWRELDFKLRSGPASIHPLTWRAWATQIEAIWDRKFFLHRVECKRGRRCKCALLGCCKYPLRIFARQGAAHGSVKLRVGGPKRENRGKPGLWWTSHTWWTKLGDARPVVRAHEFGHLIGCYDEYRGGACHPSGQWINESTSIMGSGTMVYPRHLDVFRRMFEAASPIVGPVELVRI